MSCTVKKRNKGVGLAKVDVDQTKGLKERSGRLLAIMGKGEKIKNNF